MPQIATTIFLMLKRLGRYMAMPGLWAPAFSAESKNRS